MTYVEEVVAHRDDLKNGEMKQVVVGEHDVLLVRHDDEFYALHAYCSHYGAPLVDGALSDGRIVCPWHHSCYDATNGNQIEPPGLDSLEAFQIEMDGDDVVVRVPQETDGHRILPLARRSDGDSRTFVILGGGAAGEYASEALRQNGFTGRILMITRENETPYDRPNCSKEYLMGEAPDEWMFLRGEDFYDDGGIERMHGAVVTQLDARAKTITLESGEAIRFDAVVICTGGIPATLNVPGSDLEGIFTLRSLADSSTIMEAGRSSINAVVVGASFIGMEVAYSLKELGVEEVTVVAPEKVPFARSLGERVGKMVRDIHEENEVRFRLGHTVREFRGGELVERVVLDDGSEIKADMVVIGIGVRPATNFIEGVERAEDGGVLVDETLKAGDGVYAAGDIARFPYWLTGEPIRVEHWRLACQHGRIAGTNLAAESAGASADGQRPEPYRSIPFFWTVHFGVSLRYVGHATEWDEIIYDGSPEERRFIAFYVKGEQVLAACGVDRDTEMAAIEELMRRRRMPSLVDLKRKGVDYVARLRD